VHALTAEEKLVRLAAHTKRSWNYGLAAQGGLS
jgi:hypothetical protein